MLYFYFELSKNGTAVKIHDFTALLWYTKTQGKNADWKRFRTNQTGGKNDAGNDSK